AVRVEPLHCSDAEEAAWFVGEASVTGEYESLADCFDDLAEKLTKIGGAEYPVCGVSEGRLVWT
ncbi:hypothetical protein ACWDPI_18810, partial [Streptomyces zhihengii]